ncbi:PRTRC system protein B [Chryseobacterium defluvii]|uniref:PRTRC genetic system protein B n=1 Tax=Chryseobacterium defluvii TaxID=160396 RepID=A0A495SN76_9FLAO|nr:PRTRC system protein B [Chryseobacterium defluvii]RKT01769.1 PRTRC genetic system protein B [Chryseobacterium defluvii]
MKNIDITQDFEGLYHPKCALVVYEAEGRQNDIYVEHFDMDSNGNPINAHPLTIKEAEILSKALQIEQEKENGFLKPKTLLPTNILSLDPSTEKGTVIWHTKAQLKQLFFVESLGIPNGKAHVPPLLWKANKHKLSLFALKSNRRPSERTKLFHAPFFNVYNNGSVCMGTVHIDIKKSTSVEEFIQGWEHYFFNSYFSHLLESGSHIKGNCVSLWKRLIKQGASFPSDVLMPNHLTLKNILP